MHKILKRTGHSALVAIAVSAPLPALALSCMKPDPVQSIGWLQERGVEHTAVYGNLSFEGDFHSVVQNLPHEQSVQGQRKSAVLTGVDVATGAQFDEVIAMERMCSGPWCGGASPGKDLLIIIEEPRTDPTVRLGACGGHVFLSPAEEVIDQVRETLHEKDRETER